MRRSKTLEVQPCMLWWRRRSLLRTVFAPHRVRPYVTDYCSGRSDERRQAAVKLALSGDARALIALWTMAYERGRCKCSVEAVSHATDCIGDDHVGLLTALLNHGNEEIRSRAQSTISRITGTNHNIDFRALHKTAEKPLPNVEAEKIAQQLSKLGRAASSDEFTRILTLGSRPSKKARNEICRIGRHLHNTGGIVLMYTVYYRVLALNPRTGATSRRFGAKSA